MQETKRKRYRKRENRGVKLLQIRSPFVADTDNRLATRTHCTTVCREGTETCCKPSCFARYSRVKYEGFSEAFIESSSASRQRDQRRQSIQTTHYLARSVSVAASFQNFLLVSVMLILQIMNKAWSTSIPLSHLRSN